MRTETDNRLGFCEPLWRHTFVTQELFNSASWKAIAMWMMPIPVVNGRCTWPASTMAVTATECLVNWTWRKKKLTGNFGQAGCSGKAWNKFPLLGIWACDGSSLPHGFLRCPPGIFPVVLVQSIWFHFDLANLFSNCNFVAKLLETFVLLLLCFGFVLFLDRLKIFQIFLLYYFLFLILSVTG